MCALAPSCAPDPMQRYPRLRCAFVSGIRSVKFIAARPVGCFCRVDLHQRNIFKGSRRAWSRLNARRPRESVTVLAGPPPATIRPCPVGIRLRSGAFNSYASLVRPSQVVSPRGRRGAACVWWSRGYLRMGRPMMGLGRVHVVCLR